MGSVEPRAELKPRFPDPQGAAFLPDGGRGPPPAGRFGRSAAVAHVATLAFQTLADPAAGRLPRLVAGCVVLLLALSLALPALLALLVAARLLA